MNDILRKKMKDKGLSITFVAKKLGITREGLYKKINYESEFKASEIRKLRELLELSPDDIDKIFFVENSECNSLLSLINQ